MSSPDQEMLAALDCGTNSIRLLIADLTGRELIRETQITRLGQGVAATGALAPQAVARTLSVLTEYHWTMQAHGVQRRRMVATSAVRDARNGADFLGRAAEILGFEPQLLSGEEEGRLAFAGALADLVDTDADAVVVDIGGGSTELVLGRAEPIDVVSLDIGSVRLTECLLATDPPTADEISCGVAMIRRDLDKAKASVPAFGSLEEGTRMIGLAGTVTTMAALILGLTEYRRDRIHRASLSVEAVADMSAVLLSESAEQRARRAAIPRGRADVIGAGALILREVMTWLNVSQCIASEADILDGMIKSLRETERLELTRPSGAEGVDAHMTEQ